MLPAGVARSSPSGIQGWCLPAAIVLGASDFWYCGFFRPLLLHMGSWPMVLIQWVCLAIRLYQHGDGWNLVWPTSLAAPILRRLPAPSDCVDSILATSAQPRHDATWLRDPTPGKLLLGSVSRELQSPSKPATISLHERDSASRHSVGCLQPVGPSQSDAKRALRILVAGNRSSSPSLARLTFTPWTKDDSGRLGQAPLSPGHCVRPGGGVSVLGVRFSSAWCCAPSENYTTLHHLCATTSLGNNASHGLLRQACGLMPHAVRSLCWPLCSTI